MPVPGYDPDDLETLLTDRIEGRESEFLTEAERRRWDDGEELVDILDAEDIDRLVETN